MPKATFIATILVAAGLVVSDAASAQEPGSSWYVSALGSYVDDDQDRNADDGLAGGQFSVGIPFRGAWNLEVFGLYNEFNADGFDNDQEQTAFGVGVIRWFNVDGALSPYVGAAGGYSDTDKANGFSESAPMTSGALGLLVRFGNTAFGWRSEARYRRVLEDFALSDVYLSSGVSWAFGGDRRPARLARSDEDGDGVADAYDLCPGTRDPVVDARGCPEADTDRDGVVNRLDRCPRTPRNIGVNSRGCAPDGDRDGVIDALDACRGTAWEAVVDERGCARDASDRQPAPAPTPGVSADEDGDGVADADDRCPGTAAGRAVDTTGCAAAETIALEGVAFEINSSVLKAGSRTALDRLAAVLLARPGVRAEVAGHTDDDGDAAYNQWLSERRANAVRDYLIEQGVPAERLTAKGYGEARPVADNATAAGRAQNRRVELTIR